VTDEATPPGCPSCGEYLPHVQSLIDQLASKDEAIDHLEAELRSKRSQLSRARNKRLSDTAYDPQMPEARECFDYWRERLAPAAREFTGKRLDNVLARLHAGTDVERIKRGIDGCARKPYVTDSGREATGLPTQRFADLELICRSESHLDRFVALAEEHVAPAVPTAAGGLDAGALAGYQAALDDPAILARLAQLRGWAPDVVLGLGLGLDEHRIVFPVCDGAGKLVGLHRYQPNPERRGGPKMIAEGARDLFPAPETIDASTVWLVEGEPDAVACRSAGLPAVGVPGTATWKQGWPQRFAKFDTVYVCFDCDEPGRTAAEQRLSSLGALTRAVLVDLAPDRSDGYDVGDLLLDYRANAGAEMSARASTTGGSVVPIQPRIGDVVPFDRLVRALEDADCRVQHRHHGQATAQCPVHDDRQPSLSVTEGADARVLVHCHAGCTAEQVCEALDLKLSALFPRTFGQTHDQVQ
jgi:hypothetical protein